MKFADLTDCVSACAGDHDISHGKQIRKLVLDIFILDVSGSTVERFIGFPFPQRWTTWNSFRSSGRILRTLSLTEAAPRLPPITISTGLSAVKPQNLRPFSAFPERSSWRIGVPVRTALSAGRLATVSGKLQQILDAEERQSLLARPGVMSDSWINAGIFKRLAAITTGTVTKPPLEKQRPVSALSESFWPG